VSKPFLVAFGVAVIAIIGVVWWAFAGTAGNHLVPTGKIGKVRTLGVGDDLTYMVIDFNVRNDSDRDMVVRTVDSVIDTADGGMLMGTPVAVRSFSRLTACQPPSVHSLTSKNCLKRKGRSYGNYDKRGASSSARPRRSSSLSARRIRMRSEAPRKTHGMQQSPVCPADRAAGRP